MSSDHLPTRSLRHRNVGPQVPHLLLQSPRDESPSRPTKPTTTSHGPLPLQPDRQLFSPESVGTHTPGGESLANRLTRATWQGRGPWGRPGRSGCSDKGRPRT
eukprot:9477253-Pyramimonas_sp.AAC.1